MLEIGKNQIIKQIWQEELKKYILIIVIIIFVEEGSQTYFLFFEYQQLIIE